MLKQIVATSALMAIVAVAAQAASAADTTKFRELVIEPAAAQAESGNVDAKKRQRLLLLPSEGTATADAGKGEAGHFVVAPIEGLLTPTDGGNKAKAKQAFPTLAKASDGIATPVKFTDAGADQTRTDGSKAFPLIASAPQGLTTPADVTADAEGSIVDGATAVETKAAIPAAPKAAIAKSGGRADHGRSGAGRGDCASQGPLHAPDRPRLRRRDPEARRAWQHGLLRDHPGQYEGGRPPRRRQHLHQGHPAEARHRLRLRAPGDVHPSLSSAYAGEDNCDRTAGY